MRSRIQIRISGLIQIRMTAGSVQKCCGFILLSARVISPSIIKIGQWLWEIPMKLVKSPIPQLWRKQKSDPKCTRESGSQPKVNHFQRVAPCPSLPYSRGSPLAQVYHVWLTKRPFPHSSVILLTEWQTDRTTNHTTASPEQSASGIQHGTTVLTAVFLVPLC